MTVSGWLLIISWVLSASLVGFAAMGLDKLRARQGDRGSLSLRSTEQKLEEVRGSLAQ